MAADGRQPQPPLDALPDPRDMDFFALLRRLEVAAGSRFGHGRRPEQEPARLGQGVRLGFATRDVTAFAPAAGNRPARVEVAVIGLAGPEGPLPLHLTRWLLDRLGQRWYAGNLEAASSDTSFLDLLNVIQHRMIALFYRAWADQRPEVQAGRAGAGRLGAMVRALAGPGPLETARHGEATALARQVRAPGQVVALAAAATGAPVALAEFVGAWGALPARLQSRLGGPHAALGGGGPHTALGGGGSRAALGGGATLGPRVFGRQSRFELRVGPLTLDGYRAFLPGGPRLAALRLALLSALGESLDADVRLVLARAEVPAARLGASHLGRTAWIGGATHGRDADDLRLAALVGLAPDGPRAAA